MKNKITHWNFNSETRNVPFLDLAPIFNLEGHAMVVFVSFMIWNKDAGKKNKIENLKEQNTLWMGARYEKLFI